MSHLKLVPPLETLEPQKNKIRRRVTAIALAATAGIGLGATYGADETAKGPEIQLSKTADCSLKTEALALKDAIQSNEEFSVSVMKPEEDWKYYEVFTRKANKREDPALLTNPVALYCGSTIVGLAGIYDKESSDKYRDEFPHSYKLRGNKNLDKTSYKRDLGVLPHSQAIIQKTEYEGFDPEAAYVRSPNIQVSTIKSVDIFSLGDTNILHDFGSDDHYDSLGGGV